MKNTNYFEPLFEYALPTYILSLPTFIISQLHIPPTIAFAIASIPFSGRIVGALSYQYLLRIMGSKVTVILSLISLGFLSMLDGLINNVEFLLVSRFLIGALFGISTSIAVSEAIMSRSRFSTSLTMSGWGSASP